MRIMLRLRLEIIFVAFSLRLRIVLWLRIILRLYFISVGSSFRFIVWPVSFGMMGLMWPVNWSVAWVLFFIYFIRCDVLIRSIIIRARRICLLPIFIIASQGNSTQYTNYK